MKKIIMLLVLISLILGCDKYDKISDAYGNFECEEISLSSETNGILETVFFQEGDEIEKNQLLAIADTTDKQLRKRELEIQHSLLNLKYQKTQADISVMKTELDIAIDDVTKHQKLYDKNVIALEVLENYQHKQTIMQKQYASFQLNLSLINQEIKQLGVKIEQAKRELDKCYLKSPVSGTLLSKYVQKGELVTIGKPVFKIANLDDTYLKAYVTQTQLSSIDLNQRVTILIDDQSGLRELTGTISYISSKAEFTPKTIQTRDERTNLVYSIKISVDYEDSIKIGMPAEVLLKEK